MADYDLLSLSPLEFETLIRDLLQTHLKLFLESFGAGRDQGIDLRYAENNGLVVQCKRYSNFDDLFANLKKEILKLRILKPSRYLIATSVSMSPERKRRYLIYSSHFY